MNSPLYDISTGTTVFTFNNAVDTNKFGQMQLKKSLNRVNENDSSETPEFSFEVKLDGVKLPVGTAYTVGGATKKVETEGIVKLRAGETLTISNILAGSKYEVREVNLPDGYKNVSLSNGSGVVPAANPVVLNAVNREQGTTVEIPISKTVSNPDGVEHRYTIQMVQLGAEDQPISGTAVQKEITVKEGTVTDAFVLSYVSAQMEPGEYHFTYKVSEVSDSQAEGYTDFDTTVYTAEVCVTKAEDGELTASVQILKPDGTQTNVAAFVNTLRLKNLTVKKEVRASDTPEKDSFDFILTLEYPGLNGEYVGTIGETSVPVKVENGTAKVSFDLKHGEAFVLKGLPEGTTWTVTEESRGDYWTKIFVGETETSGNSATSQLDADAAVTFVNNLYYALPETGGGGLLGYITGGGGLIALALLMYIKTRKGRRRSAQI